MYYGYVTQYDIALCKWRKDSQLKIVKVSWFKALILTIKKPNI